MAWGVRPKKDPRKFKEMPRIVKLNTKPKTIQNGRHFDFPREVDKTMGRTGKTQGLRKVRTPAKRHAKTQ